MDYTHIQKNVSHSPRKLRLLADMIRSTDPGEAMLRLKFASQSAGETLSKAIKAALSNSGNADSLRFKKLEINEGTKMKRFRPGSKGRVYPYKKRLSHIKIVLTDEVQAVDESKNKKRAKIKNEAAKEVIEAEVVSAGQVENIEQAVEGKVVKRVRKEKEA